MTDYPVVRVDLIYVHRVLLNTLQRNKRNTPVRELSRSKAPKTEQVDHIAHLIPDTPIKMVRLPV